MQTGITSSAMPLTNVRSPLTRPTPAGWQFGCRQFNSVLSNFRQAGYGYTTDAGLHWTFPGVLQNNVFRSDPVLDSDDTGNFFYLSLLVDTFCGDIRRSPPGAKPWPLRSPQGA